LKNFWFIMGGAVLIGLLLWLIYLMPILFLWCIDQLAGTDIPVDLRTWIASFLILSLFSVNKIQNLYDKVILDK